MKPWTFVHVSDIQVGSPRSYRFRPAWNENWQAAREQILTINPDLLLVGGDLTRDGGLHDYELASVKADLDALPFPSYVVAGNSDTGNKHTSCSNTCRDWDDPELNVTSAQLKQFESFFGPLQWSVVHKQVRFSGFYPAIAGSGLSQEQVMWDWLEGLAHLPRQSYHVMIIHYPLWLDSVDEPNFDITDPEQYKGWYININEPHRGRIIQIFKTSAVSLVISGHAHCRKTTEEIIDGIRFQKGPAVCNSGQMFWPDGDPTLGFFRYDVTDQGVCCKFIPLKSVSTTPGYGPSGHPRPEDRDYSKAWDK